VVVAVRADRETGRTDARRAPARGLEVLARCATAPSASSSGSDANGRGDLLVDLGREQRERLAARLLGREVPSRCRAPASAAVHAAVTSPSRQRTVRQPDGIVEERVERQLPAAAERRDETP
jgi:hypothetical protein